MKIFTAYRSDLLGITARLDYWQDETLSATQPADLTFEAAKLNGELVEFTIRHGRHTSRTFSWMLTRAALLDAKMPPEVISFAATLSCPLVSRD